MHGQIDWNHGSLSELLPSVTHSNLTVRPGAESDLEQLNDTYNQYVKETLFTFDVEPMTMDARRDGSRTMGQQGGTGCLSPSRTMPSSGSRAAAAFGPSPPTRRLWRPPSTWFRTL